MTPPDTRPQVDVVEDALARLDETFRATVEKISRALKELAAAPPPTGPLCDWIVDVESDEGATRTVAAFEAFAAALDDDHRAHGPAPIMRKDTGSLGAGFNVDATDAVAAATLARAIFTEALTRAGIKTAAPIAKISIELARADEPAAAAS